MSSFNAFKSFASPKALLTFCKYSTAASVTAATSWQLWFKDCYFEPFGPANDPLFQTEYFQRYNPHKHPSLDDSCVRKVALSKIEPALVEDALNGGSKLVERFCGGIWGGYGFAIQRKLMAQFCKTNSNKGMLWDKRQLLDNSYETGTIVTDHAVVLAKDAKSIVMRGGMSPLVNPDTPREMDNISEIAVDIDLAQGEATFKLKNIFFNGVENTGGLPFPPPVVWLHYQYCKLLVEAGVSHCVS